MLILMGTLFGTLFAVFSILIPYIADDEEGLLLGILCLLLAVCLFIKVGTLL